MKARAAEPVPARGLSLQVQSQARPRPHPVAAGIVVSLANPYWTIWWATIGLNYAALALKSGWPGIASFYAGHILADLVWYSIIAAAVASGRKICPRPVYIALIAICGVVLVGLGVYFGISGWARFR